MLLLLSTYITVILMINFKFYLEYFVLFQNSSAQRYHLLTFWTETVHKYFVYLWIRQTG